MGVASLVVSIVALIIAVIGLIPLLGLLEWIALILGTIGFVFGIIPIARRFIAPLAISGLVISIVAIVMAVLRLAIGGWFG